MRLHRSFPLFPTGSAAAYLTYLTLLTTSAPFLLHSRYFSSTTIGATLVLYILHELTKPRIYVQV